MIALLLACCPPDCKDTDVPADTDTDTDTDTDSDTDTDTDTDTDPAPLRLAIPAYAYPGDTVMDAWIAGAGATRGLVILNPNNGPATTQDPAYVQAVADARAAGAIPLGYVYTRYGDRPADAVDADVAAWRDLYGVDGIFFDEVTDTCDDLAWYAARAAAADAADADGDAFVALNPGVASCEGYLDTADLLVVAEDAAELLDGWSPASWTSAYDADRFWLLAHTASAAQMATLAERARLGNVGWFYATDDVLPNPWDELPVYWEEELGEM